MTACPRCLKSLTTFKNTSPIGEVSLDVCLDCGTRSAPLALLENALTPLTWKRLVQSLPPKFHPNKFHTHQIYAQRAITAKPRLSERACPTCATRMHEASIEILSRKQKIEACLDCGTAWFDHRELEHLPILPEAEESFRLPDHTREALADIEIQNGRRVANRSSFRVDARDFGFGWGSRTERPSGWKFLLGIFLIPVERDNRLARAPWATLTLIAVVFVISVLGFTADPIVAALGVREEDALRWWGFNLISYFFVHGGWYHLLSNLYFLWLYGDNIEDEVGSARYLAVLACGTIGGALLHFLFDPNSKGLLIGASGGISTLGMLYSLRFPRGIFAFFILPLFRWVRVPAYVLMAIWIFTQLQGAADQIEGLTQVSALCHLGGALVGIFAWYVLYPRAIK